MTERLLIYVEIQHFLVEAECADTPSLRYVPMALCGDPALRGGRVIGKNEKAHKAGIMNGDTIAEAFAKCPELAIVRPDLHKYLRYARRIRELGKRYTEKVFPGSSFSTLWLDVTDVCHEEEDALRTAKKLQEEIRYRLSFDSRMGIGPDVLCARLALEQGKESGVSIIKREDREKTLATMPVSVLLSVGRVTETKLESLGIRTIDELLRADEKNVVEALGEKGKNLLALARGDDSAFRPENRGENGFLSLGVGVTPLRPIEKQEDAEAFLYLLAEALSKRLALYELQCERLCLTFSDGEKKKRRKQKLLRMAASDPGNLFEVSRLLLRELTCGSCMVTGLSLQADKLSDDTYHQLSLFEEMNFHPDPEMEERLSAVMKEYGSRGVQELTDYS